MSPLFPAGASAIRDNVKQNVVNRHAGLRGRSSRRQRTLAGNNAEAQGAPRWLALLAAAAALHRNAPDIAALFARTRLAGRPGANFGTSNLSQDEAILRARVLPAC